MRLSTTATCLVWFCVFHGSACGKVTLRRKLPARSIDSLLLEMTTLAIASLASSANASATLRAKSRRYSPHANSTIPLSTIASSPLVNSQLLTMHRSRFHNRTHSIAHTGIRANRLVVRAEGKVRLDTRLLSQLARVDLVDFDERDTDNSSAP